MKSRCMKLGWFGHSIGLTFLIITLGTYMTYLVLLEDFQKVILEELYGISSCTFPPTDTLIGVSFQYSIIANFLLIIGCVGCTRWLLIPWLIVYLINSLVLVCLSIFLFSVPFPILHSNMEGTIQYQMLRFLGFIPLILALLILHCWLVIRRLFLTLVESAGIKSNPGYSISLKTSVQVLGGVLAILSGVFLVAFFSKLDDIIQAQYTTIFKDKLSRSTLTCMAGTIVLAILCNILLILGGARNRWRKLFLVPWLILYGFCGIVCILAHIYFTSLCARDKKMIGWVFVFIGCLILLMWSLVWVVATSQDQREEGFQRLELESGNNSIPRNFQMLYIETGYKNVPGNLQRMGSGNTNVPGNFQCMEQENTNVSSNFQRLQ